MGDGPRALSRWNGCESQSTYATLVLISQSSPLFSRSSHQGDDSDTFENSAKLLPLARVFVAADTGLKNSARQPFTTYPKNKATGSVRYCINGSNSPLFIGRLPERPNAVGTIL